jgi:hypothetical protein
MNTISWYALDAIGNYLTPDDQMRHALTRKGIMSAYLWALPANANGSHDIGVGSSNPEAVVRYEVMLNSLKLDVMKRCFIHSLQEALDCAVRPFADPRLSSYFVSPPNSSSWSNFARKHLRARPSEDRRRPLPSRQKSLPRFVPVPLPSRQKSLPRFLQDKEPEDAFVPVPVPVPVPVQCSPKRAQPPVLLTTAKMKKSCSRFIQEIQAMRKPPGKRAKRK